MGRTEIGQVTRPISGTIDVGERCTAVLVENGASFSFLYVVEIEKTLTRGPLPILSINAWSKLEINRNIEGMFPLAAAWLAPLMSL